jgi:hypothetical protein
MRVRDCDALTNLFRTSMLSRRTFSSHRFRPSLSGIVFLFPIGLIAVFRLELSGLFEPFLGQWSSILSVLRPRGFDQPLNSREFHSCNFHPYFDIPSALPMFDAHLAHLGRIWDLYVESLAYPGSNFLSF